MTLCTLLQGKSAMEGVGRSSFFFSTHYKILNARRGRKIREHNASQEGLESTDIRPNLF